MNTFLFVVFALAGAALLYGSAARRWARRRTPDQLPGPVGPASVKTVPPSDRVAPRQVEEDGATPPPKARREAPADESLAAAAPEEPSTLEAEAQTPVGAADAVDSSEERHGEAEDRTTPIAAVAIEERTASPHGAETTKPPPPAVTLKPPVPLTDLDAPFESVAQGAPLTPTVKPAPLAPTVKPPVPPLEIDLVLEVPRLEASPPTLASVAPVLPPDVQTAPEPPAAPPQVETAPDVQTAPEPPAAPPQVETAPEPEARPAPPKTAGATMSPTAELEKADPRHAQARRLARLAVSEIKLYKEAEVKEGRAASDLWHRLNVEIKMAVSLYEKRVPEEVRASFDYLYDELLRQLAEGDAARFGADAPTISGKPQAP